MSRRMFSTAHGFTLVELMVTLALLGVLALAVLPLQEVVATRLREAELRSALRAIRGALDAYKAAADSGAIQVQTGESGYPPSLEALVKGVEINARNAVTAAGQSSVQRLVFLRRIPRDPFATDADIPDDQTWDTRAYGTTPDAPAPGADVFDVSSRSTRRGLDGRPYNTW